MTSRQAHAESHDARVPPVMVAPGRYPRELRQDPRSSATQVLVPIVWGSGTGSKVMRRIAAPMVGGMICSSILTLIVIPANYGLVNEFSSKHRPAS